MSNMLQSKTVKKVTLLSVILAIVFALSIVLVAVLGVNYAPTLKDCETLTVTVNTKAYEDKLEDIQSVCDTAYANNGVSYTIVKFSKMSGDDCEIAYEFAKGTDLSAVKASLTATFAEKTAGEWNGSFITVSTGSEKLFTAIPTSYVVRAAIATAVFAVLAFVYVAIRYRLSMGILVAICSALGSVMSAAVVLLVRVPVTNSLLYIVSLAAPVTATLVMFMLNKVRTAIKAGKDENAEELIVNACPCKEWTITAIVGGVALVLIGAIATTAVRWFAVASLVAFVVTLFIGCVFAPAAYLPLKKAEDKRLAKKSTGYIGAEKKEDEE